MIGGRLVEGYDFGQKMNSPFAGQVKLFLPA